MKLLVLAAAGSVMVVAGCGGRGETLFPVKSGSVWTYTGTVDGRSVTTEASIASSREANGGRDVTIRWTENTLALQEETYRITETEVTRSRSGAAGAESFDPPVPVLRLPLSVGKRWSWHGKMSYVGRSLPASAVVHVTGREPVRTAAGEFDAFRVGMSFDIQNPAIKNSRQKNAATVWYAPGVGIVKQFVDQTSPDGETRQSSRELVGFKLGQQ